MNKIENYGDMLEIHSHINEKAIQIIEKLAENNLERIQFEYDSVFAGFEEILFYLNLFQ